MIPIGIERASSTLNFTWLQFEQKFRGYFIWLLIFFKFKLMTTFLIIVFMSFVRDLNMPKFPIPAKWDVFIWIQWKWYFDIETFLSFIFIHC